MKAPIQVAAALRVVVADLRDVLMAVPAGQTTSTIGHGLLRTAIDAADAGIDTITSLIQDFRAEVAKELATGAYWPMDTAPTGDGDRILGLVQRGHAGGRVVVEPRVLVRRNGRWCSLPGGWTAPVLGWRPVPAEDIVTERGKPATW